MKLPTGGENRLPVLKIVGAYCFFGVLWISFSDIMISWVARDPDLTTRITLYKGLLFISLTTVLLYYLMSRHVLNIEKAENQLRESEERYRSILENMQEGYYEIDLKGNLASFNQSLCKYLGYRPTELMGMNNRAYTSAEMAREAYLFYSDIYRTGRSRTMTDYEVIRKDGDKRIHDTSVSPIRNSSGEIIGFRGLTRDVTERKVMEKAREESESRYRLLAENASDIIFTMDTSLRFTYISPSVEKIRGFTVEEAMAQSPMEALAPTSLNVAIRAYTEELELEAKGIEPLRTRTMELEETCKDGSTVWTESRFSPMHDRNDKFIGLLGITRDITGRKQVESERSRLIAILESTSDLIATTMPDGQVTHVNAAGRRMLGLGVDEDVLQYNMTDVYPQWALKIVMEKGMPAALEHGVWEGETAVMTKGGHEIPVSQVIMTHRSANGELEFLSTIIRDISERKQAEEALEESERRYHTLADNVHDVIFVFNLDLEPKYISPSVKYLTGYSVEEAITKRLDESLTPDSYERLKETFKREVSFERNGQKRNRGWSLTIEQEIIRKDGALIWIEVTLNFVYDKEGTRKSIIGVARDITDRKRSALERERLVCELQEALANMKILSGLIPICSYCKKIRDDKGYWNQLESYISQHSDALFSHGICPECIEKGMHDL